MAKSKHHLIGKRHDGNFNENYHADREERAKRTKRQRRQGRGGTNKVWLRTRHRVKREVLGG